MLWGDALGGCSGGTVGRGRGSPIGRGRGFPNNPLPPPGRAPLPQLGCYLGVKTLSAPIRSDAGSPPGMLPAQGAEVTGLSRGVTAT